MKALGPILFRICFIIEFNMISQVTESYSARASRVTESSLTLITSGVGVTVSRRP